MNEVWKKPPVSLEAYQNMVGKEVGVSSWHLVDQNRINVYADVIEEGNRVRHHRRARFSDDVADVHHVL
jgi:hypothetical protein